MFPSDQLQIEHGEGVQHPNQPQLTKVVIVRSWRSKKTPTAGRSAQPAETALLRKALCYIGIESDLPVLAAGPGPNLERK